MRFPRLPIPGLAGLLAAALLSSHQGLFAQAETAPSPTPPVAVPPPAVPPTDPLPEVVATVNDEPIRRAELERVAAALLNANGRSPADLSPDERRKLMRAVAEELVTDRLVAQQAAVVPVSDAEVDRRVEALQAGKPAAEFEGELRRSGQTIEDLKQNLRAEIRQGRWMEAQVAGQVKASDAEITDYYQQNPKNFQAPETVRASHILVRVTQDATPEIVQEKENFARSLRERTVDHGESFAELARQFSDDAGSKDKGGDLGYFSRERMVPEFAEAAFRLGRDEVSAPVHTVFGYHLIKLTDRREPRVIPLEEARPNIKSFLETDRRRQAVSKLIARLHEGAKVQVNVP